MTQFTFAITVLESPNYPHYQIFKEIAETIHYGLLQLGYDSVLTYELTLSNRIYIVLSPHNLGCFEDGVKLPPNAILYNFEQIYPDSPWVTPIYLDYLLQYPVWDYSKANIRELAQLGVNNVQYVPLGYVSEINHIQLVDNQDIDILFYGRINDRRQKIVDKLKSKGVNIRAVCHVYGDERDRLIARSKMVLNIHYYDAKIFEIARVFYLLANQKLVVSEVGTDKEAENAFAPGMVFAEYNSLVETCIYYLQHPDERNRIAEAGFQIMQARPEKDFLAAVMPSIQYEPRENKKFIKDIYRKRLAKQYFEENEYEKAINIYEQSIEIDPLCLESYCYLGLSLLYSGEELGAQFAWSLGIDQETEDSEEIKTLELIKLFRGEIERQKKLENLDFVNKIEEQILLFDE